jgi:hypothetical protein
MVSKRSQASAPAEASAPTDPSTVPENILRWIGDTQQWMEQMVDWGNEVTARVNGESVMAVRYPPPPPPPPWR